MDKEIALKDLIKSLQKSVNEEGMTSDFILKATKKLQEIDSKYSYNHDRFPILENTNSFEDKSNNSPSNLAEALLWKLGKWKDYKKFVQQYSDDSSKPKETDVVFYAFARHLKDPKKPIYDQHAIRAIWAICHKAFSQDEKMKCKKLLLNKNEKWKPAGSGKHAIQCYSIFIKYIDEIEKSQASKREIDLLLMPLGQALKLHSKNYKEFSNLCGLSRDL